MIINYSHYRRKRKPNEKSLMSNVEMKSRMLFHALAKNLDAGNVCERSTTTALVQIFQWIENHVERDPYPSFHLSITPDQSTKLKTYETFLAPLFVEVHHHRRVLTYNVSTQVDLCWGQSILLTSFILVFKVCQLHVNNLAILQLYLARANVVAAQVPSPLPQPRF
jgi:hypothetical protein